MRRYETLFIVTPESSEEDLKAVATKFKGVVTAMSGQVAAYKDEGKKKLAYNVKKQNKGYFMLMDYLGPADLVAEVERNMRLDDRILKYMTVKVADAVDPETVQVQESDSEPDTSSDVVPEPEAAPSAEALESEEEES